MGTQHYTYQLNSGRTTGLFRVVDGTAESFLPNRSWRYSEHFQQQWQNGEPGYIDISPEQAAELARRYAAEPQPVR